MSRREREVAARHDYEAALYEREARLQPGRAVHLLAKAEEHRESAYWGRKVADTSEAGAS